MLNLFSRTLVLSPVISHLWTTKISSSLSLERTRLEAVSLDPLQVANLDPLGVASLDPLEVANSNPLEVAKLDPLKAPSLDLQEAPSPQLVPRAQLVAWMYQS